VALQGEVMGKWELVMDDDERDLNRHIGIRCNLLPMVKTLYFTSWFTVNENKFVQAVQGELVIALIIGATNDDTRVDDMPAMNIIAALESGVESFKSKIPRGRPATKKPTLTQDIATLTDRLDKLDEAFRKMQGWDNYFIHGFWRLVKVGLLGNQRLTLFHAKVQDLTLNIWALLSYFLKANASGLDSQTQACNCNVNRPQRQLNKKLRRPSFVPVADLHQA
ncbi:hypothetical protein GIB67_002934, partial [Kingdonia uniflora]